MKCKDLYLMLEDFSAEKSLNAEARQHLRECAACAQYAGELEQTNAALRRALSQPPSQAAWQRVKTGLAAKLAAADVPARRRSAWRYWMTAAAAAVVLVAALLAFHFIGAGKPQASQIAVLQTKVKQEAVLDELMQLQTAFDESGRSDDKALAEDAELYVERIMRLNANDAEQCRETLSGIKAAQIAQKLRTVRQNITPQNLTTVAKSLDVVVAALDEADKLAGRYGGRNAN